MVIILLARTEEITRAPTKMDTNRIKLLSSLLSLSPNGLNPLRHLRLPA
jgi:hypothetical protein